MAFLRAVRVVACALVLCGCAARPMATLQIPDQAQLGVVKERLFVLVQAERERLNNGAKPLMLDPELMRAAQIHSDDMALKHSFDTGNPAGNLAVNTLLMNPKFRGFVGENSAAQYYTPGKPIDAQNFARGFLTIWENNPDHRSNMQFPGFDRTGIGITVSGNMVYAAELFATDLGLPEPQ